MQGFVTQPIAQSVATVEGIDYLSSSSTQGRSVITVRMKLNADSNKAMTEVMAKVNGSSTACRATHTTRCWSSRPARRRRWPTWAFPARRCRWPR